MTCFLCKQPGHLSSSYKNINTISAAFGESNTENFHPLADTALPPFESTSASTKTIIVETNLPIHKVSGGDIMNTSEELENLKRPASESICPSSPLYTTFTPPLPELGEENPQTLEDHILLRNARTIACLTTKNSKSLL